MYPIILLRISSNYLKILFYFVMLKCRFNLVFSNNFLKCSKVMKVSLISFKMDKERNIISNQLRVNYCDSCSWGSIATSDYFVYLMRFYISAC